MDLTGILSYLHGQPLLALVVVSIFVTVVGGTLRRAAPWFAGFLRGVGNLGLVAALLLTIVQVARVTTGTDLVVPGLGLQRQTVTGKETRVPMAPDGHFWVQAKINGVPRDFLVDTGATLTAISSRTANDAQVQPSAIPRTIMLQTANGTTPAEVVSLDELRFGNIVARDLDAVVAPGLGEQNVLGMNLLSRLTSWRVEDNTLILVPHHPQAEDI